MRRHFVYVLVFLCLAASLNAQRRRVNSRGTSSKPSSSSGSYRKTTRELIDYKSTMQFSILGPGPGYLFGDIGGSADPKSFLGASDWVIQDTRIFWGASGQWIFLNNMGLKATLNYGNFTGSDMRARNSYRLWTYTTDLFEGTLQGMFVLYGGPNDMGNRHMVYMSFGMGLFYSNPVFTGDLSQRIQDPLLGKMDFQQSQVIGTSIPFGLGYQYRMDDNWSIGAEAYYHYYMSDYVDGISSAFSRSNDVLFSANFTVTYQIFGTQCKTCTLAGKEWLRNK